MYSLCMPSQFWSSTEEIAPPHWYPQRYNLDGNFKDIALKTDFTCTRCHYRTWQFSPGESRTWSFRSEANDSTDWASVAPPKRWNIRFIMSKFKRIDSVRNSMIIKIEKYTAVQLWSWWKECLFSSSSSELWYNHSSKHCLVSTFFISWRRCITLRYRIIKYHLCSTFEKVSEASHLIICKKYLIVHQKDDIKVQHANIEFYWLGMLYRCLCLSCISFLCQTCFSWKCIVTFGKPWIWFY